MLEFSLEPYGKMLKCIWQYVNKTWILIYCPILTILGLSLITSCSIYLSIDGQANKPCVTDTQRTSPCVIRVIVPPTRKNNAASPLYDSVLIQLDSLFLQLYYLESGTLLCFLVLAQKQGQVRAAIQWRRDNHVMKTWYCNYHNIFNIMLLCMRLNKWLPFTGN